jgi:hypothetical protein
MFTAERLWFTKLPGCGVANVCSFAYLAGNPTSKRFEALPANAQP